jgi:hypothetical protein
MMVVRWFIIFVGAVSLGEAAEPVESWEQDWHDESIRFISNFGNEAEIENLKRLSMFIAIGGEKGPRSELRSNVAEAARYRLLATHNHASLYEQLLLQLREQHLDPKERIRYNSERQRLFRALGQIPSPQVVDLLIRLLDDNQDYQYCEAGAEILGNDTQAASVLCGMIENPPVPKLEFGYARDLSAWKKWGEQVQNGVRTFQFRGNPQRYNIHGPVDSATRTPRRIERDIPKNDVPIVPNPPEIPWFPLGAALAILIGAGWWYARSSKSR